MGCGILKLAACMLHLPMELEWEIFTGPRKATTTAIDHDASQGCVVSRPMLVIDSLSRLSRGRAVCQCRRWRQCQLWKQKAVPIGIDPRCHQYNLNVWSRQRP